MKNRKNKKELTLTFSEKELDIIIMALNFHLVKSIKDEKYADKVYAILTKMEDSIPDEWDWAGDPKEEKKDEKNY